MNWKTFYGGILCSFISASSLASEVVTGKIVSIRTHTYTHNNPGAQGYTSFTLDTTLASPCNRLYVGPEDKLSVTFLLSAQAQKSDVDVYYYTNKTSSWNSTVCNVRAIDIK